MSKDKRQTRNMTMEIQERKDDDDSGDLFLEGYFAVFGSVYQVCPGGTESIRQGAFSDSISGDVRALYNHNQDIVLGRTSAGTLELKEDSRGLWGRIKINCDDTEAMNAYSRIQRGDITQCSFGFDVEEEATESRDDGSIHWTILKVNPLYEISPCVFPAYQETNISARSRDYNQIKTRQHQVWQNETKERLYKWH